MWFDRLHFGILTFFVILRTTILSIAMGETVDDFTAVVPSRNHTALAMFVQTYRADLDSLNTKAAPADAECVKE